MAGGKRGCWDLRGARVSQQPPDRAAGSSSASELPSPADEVLQVKSWSFLILKGAG